MLFSAVDIPAYFWGDLDYAGMATSLRPGQSFLLPKPRSGYEPMLARLMSNAIRNCPLCVMKNCPHHQDYDLG